jgi:hypothetical protein
VSRHVDQSTISDRPQVHLSTSGAGVVHRRPGRHALVDGSTRRRGDESTCR